MRSGSGRSLTFVGKEVGNQYLDMGGKCRSYIFSGGSERMLSWDLKPTKGA